MIKPEALQRMRAKVQERVAATPPRTWTKMGIGVLVGGVAIGWLAFPYVLDKVVAYQINLAQGKDSRRLWVQMPRLDFNIYLFNITNPADVMRGAKPALQEVGPYCYTEVKEKTDFIEDPSLDTISYSSRNTWYENPDASRCSGSGLTGDEVFIVPNIPLMAILLIAEKDFPPPFLTLVNQALPNIFGRFTDVFMAVSARRLLFGGVKINCTAGALYPRAVCIALKQNSRALKKLGNNVYSFSFFGAKNNSLEEFRNTVKRGTEDGQEIGRLVAVDGKPQLTFWRGECNKIQGTDATVFPPFRQMENGSVTAYSSEICRVLFGVYEGQQVYKGATGYTYSISFGDTDNNPGDRCFCPADGSCLKKGVLDSLKCQGAPLAASHPHFYLGSEDYVSGVVGLNPDKEKHSTFIVLEPISGTPLMVRKRLQFNIELKPVRYVTVTQRLRRTLTPLLWVEESLDLDDDLMGLLEASLFRPIRAVDVIKWLCVVAGVGLGVTAAVLKFRQSRRDKVHVLNGEAGRDSGSGVEPQTILKPEEPDGYHNLDPSFINIENAKPFNNGVGQRLSAAALMRSVSTMTSANGGSLNNRPATITNGTKENSFQQVVPPKSIDLSLSLSDQDLLQKDNYQAVDTNTTIEDQNTYPTALLPMRNHSHQNSVIVTPESPYPFPVLQYSPEKSESIISTYPQISKLPLEGPISTSEDISTLSNTDSATTRQSLQDSNTLLDTTTKNNKPAVFENKGRAVISINTNDTSNNNHLQPERTATPVTNRNFDTIEDSERDNQEDNMKREDPGSTTPNVTHPVTEHDIKAVEEDIIKLMAEISELIPKHQQHSK